LEAAQARRKELAADLAGLDCLGAATALDEARVRRELEARAADVRGVPGRQVAQSRQMLQALLVGRLDMTPVAGGPRGRGYAFAGRVSYGAVLQGVAASGGGYLPPSLVSPGGFQPRGMKGAEALLAADLRGFAPCGLDGRRLRWRPEPRP